MTRRIFEDAAIQKAQMQVQSCGDIASMRLAAEGPTTRTRAAIDGTGLEEMTSLKHMVEHANKRSVADRTPHKLEIVGWRCHPGHP